LGDKRAEGGWDWDCKPADEERRRGELESEEGEGGRLTSEINMSRIVSLNFRTREGTTLIVGGVEDVLWCVENEGRGVRGGLK